MNQFNQLIVFFKLLLFVLIANAEGLGIDGEINLSKSHVRVPRIIGGVPHTYRNINYQVALFDELANTAMSRCGGTIIDNLFILTAAHCVVDKNNLLRNVVKQPLYVVAGTDLMNPTAIDMVSKIYVTSQYNGTTGPFISEDIAVLKLTQGLGLGSNPQIGKLLLPTIEDTQDIDKYARETAIVSGFGIYQGTIVPDPNSQAKVKIGLNRSTDNLLIAKADIMRQNDCARNWARDNRQIYPSQICARVQGFGHRGVCRGDSGSGLVYQNTIIGIVSYSGQICNESSQDGWPGVYTRVSAYLQFIQDAAVDNILSKHIRTF